MADPKEPDYGANGSIARDLGEQHRKFFQPEVISISRGTDDLASLLVVPNGRSVVSLKSYLDENLEKPRRRRGTVRLLDLASFIAIVNRNATEHSVVFGSHDGEQPSFTAVFDYHPKSNDATKADWLEHKATFCPALSEEWDAWMEKNGEFMTQAEFAAFMEDRIMDAIVPNYDDPKLKTYADLVQGKFAEPSELVKLSRELEVNVGSKVKNHVRLSSGEIRMVYEEVHSDGAGEPLQVANLFQICIPVFYGEDPYRLAVRLRYRVNGGMVAWAYDIVQPDLALTDAFNLMLDQIKNETTALVVLGSPEK